MNPVKLKEQPSATRTCFTSTVCISNGSLPRILVKPAEKDSVVIQLPPKLPLLSSVMSAMLKSLLVYITSHMQQSVDIGLNTHNYLLSSLCILLQFSFSGDSRAIVQPIKFAWLHCFVAAPRSVTLTHNNTSTECMVVCR